jgi:RNA-directed DNA polymerase
VLEPLYEQDFHPDSYGFRPGRSPHQALEVLRERLMGMGGGWVLELDIESYFDTIDHALMRDLVQQRVKDGVITRLINKWLKAGVLEDGQWHRPEAGSPQGGVISPLLSNLYLHEVLDQWFEDDVRPRLRGSSSLLRFADDAVLLFTNEHDARRVLEVLPKRFARYGLRLHPRKTRLVHFRPPRTGAGPSAESFDWLGFTHYWGKSRRGRWVVQRKTAKDRLRRVLTRTSQWCRANRHRPLREQHTRLSRKLRGHYAYYGIRGNSRGLAKVSWYTGQIWVKWLSRRSQRGHLTWDKANQLLDRLRLPPPRIVHRAVV